MVNLIKRIFRKIIKNGQEENKFFAYKEKNISIHPDSFLGSNTTIGWGTQINGPAYIESRKKYAPVVIGKYCAIAYGLRIRPRNHHTGYANLQEKFQNRNGFPVLSAIKGPVIIGNNVWIGDNVIILSGVTVGDGAVLGAGAIVTKDVPAYSIAVGSPAKVVKNRFHEKVIEQLKETNWWDWPQDKIERNHRFFSTDFTQYESLDIDSLIVD